MELRDFLAASPRASARPFARNGANRCADGLTIRALTRRRDQAAALGCVLRLLHGHRRPQMGFALSHARLLRHPGANHGRQGGAGARRSGRPPRRRRAQPQRRDTLYGRYWGCLEIQASCISRPATTRPSNTRSRMGWRASRPARRASTRSSAAICRCRPGARTGSAIPVSPPPSRISSGASARRSRRRSAGWQYSPFRKENE